MKAVPFLAVLLAAGLCRGEDMKPVIRTADSIILENSAARIELETGRGGMIGSWLDKRSGREEVYRSADGKFGSLAEPRFGGKPGAREYASARPQVTILKDTAKIKKIVFSHTPETGPNQGIECRTVYTFHADRSVLEVEWQISNHTGTMRRINPWVRNTVAGYRNIGISMDTNNRSNTGDTSFPSRFGHMHKLASGGDCFLEPARNWFARVAKEYQDPKNGILYFVFDYESVFQLYVLHFKYIHCMEMIFVPQNIQPGKHISCRYAICTAGSLPDVRFASSYAAADLERKDNGLHLSVTATGNYGEAEAQLTAADGMTSPVRKITLKRGETVTADFPDLPGSVFELKLMQNGKDLMRPEYDPGSRFRMTGTLDTIRSTQAAYVDEPKILTAWPRKAPAFPSIAPRKIAVKYPMKSSAAGLTAWAQTGTERIFEGDVPDRKLPPVSAFSVAAAGGERENFQIALHNSGKSDLKDLSVVIRGWEKTVPDCVWHPVEYIQTTQPSSFGNYPVGRWPDVLLDPGEFTLPAGKTRCVWISLQVPHGTAKGIYPAELKVYQGKKVLAELPLSLRVFGFELPVHPFFRTDVGGFFAKPRMMEMLKKDFAVTKNAKQLETELFDHLLSRRLSPRGFIQGCRDAAKFEAELTRRIKLGATSFFIPLNLTAKQRAAVEAVLKKHGVLKRSFVYAFDEIHPEQAPKVSKWCADWHKKSKIPILVVYYGGPVEPLYGSIDIWCRSTHPDDRKLLTERVAAGDEVWTTNTPLFQLETEVFEGRRKVWECFRIGMTGCLLWSCAPLSKNPFKQPFRSGTNLHGVLYYPVKGKNGLVPSIRLETFADAVDDYDYLSLLKQRVSASPKKKAAAEAEKLLQAPPPANPDELTARRLRIGELIEQLTAAD